MEEPKVPIPVVECLNASSDPKSPRYSFWINTFFIVCATSKYILA